MKIRNILAIIATIILIVDSIVENIIKFTMPPVVFYTTNILFMILFIYVIITVIMISCEKLSSSKDNLKFKYEPLKLEYDDVILWLEKGNMPDLLYFKGREKEFVKIELQFSLGRNGSFEDKGIFLDDEEMTLDEVRKEIQEVIQIEENQCILMWYTENNDPKLFLKVIEELKNC